VINLTFTCQIHILLFHHFVITLCLFPDITTLAEHTTINHTLHIVTLVNSHMACSPAQVPTALNFLHQTLTIALLIHTIMVMAFSSTIMPTVHSYVTNCIASVFSESIHALNLDLSLPACTHTLNFLLAVVTLTQMAQPATLMPARHGFETPLGTPRDRCAALDRGFNKTIHTRAV